MRLSLLLGSLLAASGLSAAPPAFAPVPPLPPARAAASFRVLDGFSMQLLAAEPLIADPVAMAYDADGRAYVCSMTDYPYTDKARHKPSQENPTDAAIGQVRLLEDTDGDGVFDKSTRFADGLSWPTGVACWQGGIFVTATPDVWYFKDTDGDGRADVREKVFTGFRKLNVQAVMNNPVWGLDHRLHVAGGSNGASITRPGVAAAQPLAIRRNDFSFDPVTRDLRLESGGARFGNSFDDWGNRFLCNIRNPCQHVALTPAALAGPPGLTAPPALHDCAEAGDQLPVYRTSPVEPWRDFRAKRWSAEGSHLPKSELVGAGVVTSSSGVTVYRGDAYPPAYRDFAFVADVAGNLFYRMQLQPDGTSFKAVQVDLRKNFCTSDDVWFRPVNFVNAPDGCLHVCDMYREVIEHPWSIPDDIHAQLDLLRGTDQGRLWRLAPQGFKPRAAPKLSRAGTAELVALLDHPNAWHRETAHRLLFERRDAAAVAPLRTLAGAAKTAQGRLHALWSLHGLEALQADDLRRALADADPRVVAQALTLAANRLPAAELQALAAKAADWPARTRLELAQALRTTRPSPAQLSALLRPGESDARLNHVVLSAAGDRIGDLALEQLRQAPAADASLLEEAAKAIANQAQAEESVRAFLTGLEQAHTAQPEASRRALVSLAQALHRRGMALEAHLSDAAARAWVQASLNEARRRALAADAALADRQAAVQTVGALGTLADLQPLLDSLLQPSVAHELQQAALEALAVQRDPQVAPRLLAAWPALSPALREKAQSALLSYPDRVQALLAALEAKTVPLPQVSAAARAQLARHRDPQVAKRAARLFEAAGGNRGEVIARYLPALAGGDAARGEKIYQLACLVCHKHGDQGNDVGPHLGTVQAWTPDQLLTNILDPNREVSPNFSLYLVETRDGRSLSGILTGETADQITLKRADGGQETLARRDLQRLTGTGTSLMPEGLEAAITPAQMADLIAFLRQP